MYKLSSNITINSTSGKISFDYIADVVIESSTETLTDTAVVKFPKKLSWKDKPITDIIKKNDKIKISLGYGDENKELFSGSIVKVKSGIPLEIRCEDDMYLLKQVKVSAKHYPSLTLKQLMSEYCNMPFEVPDVNLGEFRIDQETSLVKVIDFIRTNYVINFFVANGKLYGALPSTLLGTSSGYAKQTIKFGHNTVPGDNLEYTRQDDVKIIIKAKAIGRDNKKIEVQEPENETEGEVRTFLHPTIESKEDLKKFAQEKLKEFKVDTMTGSVVIFGQPIVNKGDTVKLLDDDNPERDNKEFLAKSVMYRFGPNTGFRQEVELGMQVSK